jgi:hypothetical protein
MEHAKEYEKIMKTQTYRSLPALPTHSGTVLRRKCACGASSASGECEMCKKKGQQRKAARAGGPAVAPPIVHEVLSSPGSPLDAQTLSFFEPRFGHDFSKVRVHADDKAAQSARAVNAMAYTVGEHMVFGASHYAPGLDKGKHLLAHELAHVAQHGANGSTFQVKSQARGNSAVHDRNELRIGLSGDASEREAESISQAVLTTSTACRARRPAVSGTGHGANGSPLQRKLVVNPGDSVPLPQGAQGPPTPLTLAIQGLIGDTCPDGQFQVDRTSGNVTPKTAQFCQPPRPPFLTAALSSTPAGCGCICDVINNAQTTTIAFHAGPPGTAPGSQPGAGAAPGQAGQVANPTVQADPRFQGQYLINGQWVDIPFHLIFAHELCGHALPKMQGTHVARGPNPAGGTPPQEQHAVDVERQIAAEHNPPLPRRPDDYSGGARQKP